MAIIEIPFFYDAEIVPNGKRTPRRIQVLDSVPVRVRELSAADAPVVATCRAEDLGSPDNWRPEPGSGLDYRAFGGGLLRPFSPGMRTYHRRDPGKVDRKRLEEDFARLRREAADGIGAPWKLLPTFDGHARRWARNSVTRAGADARTWIRDNRDAKLGALRLGMESGAAFVGGDFHVPSMGPAWKALPGLVSAVHEYSDEGAPSLALRADRRAAAVAYSGIMAEMAGFGGNGPQRPEGDIDVLDPDAFAGIDDIAIGARDVAACLTEQAAGSVGRLDPAAIVAYAGLKRAASAPPPEDAAALVADALAFEEAWLPHAREHGPSVSAPPASAFAAMMRSMIAELGDMPAPRGV